jgi:hypothetical protein
MIINYTGKYTDLKRFFLNKVIKIMHIFHRKMNKINCLYILMSECHKVDV